MARCTFVHQAAFSFLASGSASPSPAPVAVHTGVCTRRLRASSLIASQPLRGLGSLSGGRRVSCHLRQAGTSAASLVASSEDDDGPSTFDADQDGTVLFRYGEQLFSELRARPAFFADVSPFILALEKKNASHVSFVRPGQFGKTTLLSMLEAYYDVKGKDSFHDLFSGLSIYPFSKNASSFHVLRLNFSAVSITPATDVAIKKSLHDQINMQVVQFCSKYKRTINIDPDANVTLQNVAVSLRESSDPLYVMLDEYDRFANSLLTANLHAYQAAIVPIDGQPDSSELLRIFLTFKQIAGMAPGFRTFTTGISPLVLAELSGWTLSIPMGDDPVFSSSLGFTRKELARALQEIGGTSAADREVVLERMKRWFNGYRFYGGQDFEPEHELYNAAQCIFFLNVFKDRRSFRRQVLGGGSSLHPTFMSKIIPRPSHSLVRVLRHRPTVAYAVSVDLLSGEPCSVPVERFEEPFTFDDIVNPESAGTEFALARARTLLYWHGLLTFAGQDGDQVLLKVPNEMVRQLHAQYIMSVMGLADRNSVIGMVRNPSDAGLQEVIQRFIRHPDFGPLTHGSQRDEAACQSSVCGHLHGVISTLKLGNVNAWSEYGFPGGRRADIVMEDAVSHHALILEFKYLSGAKVDLPLSESDKKLFLFGAGAVSLSRKTLLQSGCTYENLRKFVRGRKPRPIRTIDGVLKAGSKQVMSYAQEYVKSHPRRLVRAFTVLVIGTYVVVSEAKAEINA